MPRLNSIMGLLSKLESAYISVSQDRCVAVRNRNASCMRCADACASGCISYLDNELSIDPTICVGCGTCATACPTSAISVKKPDDLELVAACRKASAKADGVAVIVCERMLAAASGLYDPEKVVGVTCLGRVDESLIMTLAADGVEKMALVKSACAECELATGWKTAELVRKNADTLLKTWGASMRVKLADRLPASVRHEGGTGYDSSKRAFFSRAKDGASTAAAITAGHLGAEIMGDALGLRPEAKPSRYAKVQADGTLPHCVPGRRERLISALDALGEPDDAMISTRLWGEVVIDMDRCRSCRICATFCPTGSIFKFHTAKGKIGVKHRMYQCVKCRLCEDICPENAISISDEVFARDVAERRVERYVMPPLDVPANGSKSILHSMRRLINCDQLFER